jgi:hypothetical protein
MTMTDSLGGRRSLAIQRRMDRRSTCIGRDLVLIMIMILLGDPGGFNQLLASRISPKAQRLMETGSLVRQNTPNRVAIQRGEVVPTTAGTVGRNGRGVRKRTRRFVIGGSSATWTVRICGATLLCNTADWRRDGTVVNSNRLLWRLRRVLVARRYGYNREGSVGGRIQRPLRNLALSPSDD